MSSENTYFDCINNKKRVYYNRYIGARSYSYGVYFGGVPRAMIMVLNSRNLYNKKEVMDAKRPCENQGVAYMNFMTHLPNTEEYIEKRLQENI